MSRATKSEQPYEMTPQDWAEFEEDFAIAVEMMGQGLNGETPDYQRAKRALRAEREEMEKQP